MVNPMPLAEAPNTMKIKQLWQIAMSDLITDPRELLELLQLDIGLLAAAQAATALFPLRVPRRFVERMEIGNPSDPLLLQVLPLGVELDIVAGYSRDPLLEQQVNPVTGLLHKYANRVLVTLTSACAVHCRYCFRRYFPYEDNNPGRAGWRNIIEYIQQNEMIDEVILSGGDPLSVSDRLLQQFSSMLAEVPHVKRLRIHTRLPVVLPERITDDFIAWAKGLSIPLIMVLHVNHAKEINLEVRQVLQRLQASGITMLNQTVLLKGINDDVVALANLSEALFASNVLPYYLHVLDKVEGAAHFDLARRTALGLHAKLVKVLPGYLVPRLVCEQPGELSKTLLT
jgi:EF-P beta-lysylation protein EpmB